MSLNDVLATIEVSQQIQGGMQPAEAVTFRVDAAGFHDAGGVGREGQELGTLSARSVADILRQHFDAGALRGLLVHLSDLYAELLGDEVV